MNHFLKSLFFFSLLLLTACGPDYIFNQTHTIKDSQWAYSDTLNFEIEVQDSMKIYNLYIDLEHAADFSYQNMYVMIHTQFPSDKRISEKLSLELANKGGVWLGDCNSDWCTLRVPIQEGAYFNAIGKHIITIEQYMRVNPLPGVKSVSLKVEDTGEKRG